MESSIRHKARPAPQMVHFTRQELDQILGLYGVFVASGEWKDYAIDGLSDRAVFSVFRRASEAPLYRIEKQPKPCAAQHEMMRCRHGILRVG